MLNSKEYRLLDVGGTFVKCADGRQVPIPSDGTREEISQALRQAVGPTEGLRGVAVAIPGPFDFEEGIFRMEHKFAAVKGCRFRELAGLEENIPIRFHHDVNTLLLGSLRLLGLHEGCVALVTLGTGLGFTYALDGKVQYNAAGSPERSLWNRPFGEGILEDVVSARGIRSAYARLTSDTTQSAYTVAKLAYAGDVRAMEVYDNVGNVLGEALQEMMQELPIETVLLGGQIAKSLSLMQRPLQNHLEGVSILPAPEGAVFEGLASLFD